MDLSIIIPAYNTEEYIGKMIESLWKQKYGEYDTEIIFVLNNCTDNTEKVIRSSGIECKIFNCEERGCGCARNLGLEESKGKYIWFMDSDDWLTDNYAVQNTIDALRGNDIVRVGYESNLFKRQYFSMVWQYCMSRRLIGDTRFPSIQPCEDDDFMKQIFAKIGLNEKTYTQIPIVGTYYYYLYDRKGSNMYKFHRKGRI